MININNKLNDFYKDFIANQRQLNTLIKDSIIEQKQNKNLSRNSSKKIYLVFFLFQEKIVMIAMIVIVVKKVK